MCFDSSCRSDHHEIQTEGCDRRYLKAERPPNQPIKASRAGITSKLEKCVRTLR